MPPDFSANADVSDVLEGDASARGVDRRAGAVRVVTRAGVRPAIRARTARPLSRRDRVIRAAGIGLLALGVVAGVGVVSAYLLSKSAPGWFKPQDPGDPLVMAAARRIENNVATVLTRVRKPGALAANQPASLGPDRWSIALSAQDANAWLTARLPTWLESECDPPLAWPKEVGAVQVAFEGGRIYIGASVRAGGSSDAPVRVLTASIAPEFHEDGSLWTPARSIGMGRVGVPAGLILPGSERGAGSAGPTSQIPGELGELPQTRNVLAAISGQMPTLRSPVLKIGDGRRVKLVGLDARDGRLIITLETITRGQ